MHWINTQDSLPDNRQQVLCYTPETNLFSGPANEPVHIWRMTFERGKIPGPHEPICAADQHGNNKVPWQWACENGGRLFGQDVTHWMPLPALPAEHTPMKSRRDMNQKCSHGYTRKDWIDPYNIGGCGFWEADDHTYHCNFVDTIQAMLEKISSDLSKEIKL